jgi:drug/metabolite transporter (DMT)-like permease
MRTTDAVLLGVAVACVSASGPLIAACSAPAFAIAMYRCGFGALLTAGWMLATHRTIAVPGGFTRAMLPGVALAAHFAAWIPSLRLTTVALSTAMISTQPVWSALLARVTGRLIWTGIGLAMAGVVVLTGFGGHLDARSLWGMGLALLGALLAAVYVGFGERLRATTDIGSYTTVVYGFAGLGLLVVCLVAGVPLIGYAAKDWLLIAAITLVAQIGGHSAMNAVVHRVSATVVSTAILFEAPGAAILAALFLGQPVGVSLVIGLAVMLLGLMLVVRAMPSRSPDSGV